MRRMCHDELKEAVRSLIANSGTDPYVAACALRDLAREIDPDYDESPEGEE